MIFETPVVYAVGNTYQIMFYLNVDAYASVTIGTQTFDDAVCGNMRSLPGMRRITVPMETLDTAKAYSLRIERIEARLKYRTRSLGVETYRFEFHPVPKDDARAYMIGDAHGDLDGAVSAAQAYGSFDFLIVNGDIGETADETQALSAYRLAVMLTGGTKPVVYARGNHENRGAAAELLPDFIPLRDGCTYYTFRLGSVWGIVLDCGEDKEDDHVEYGGSARFHDFRLRETAYLQTVIADAQKEFRAPGVAHRLCVVHADFPFVQEPLFDTERALYQVWCDLLGEMEVELMAMAHTHRYCYALPGDPALRLKTPCPALIGTCKNETTVGGTGLLFGKSGVEYRFTANEAWMSESFMRCKGEPL